MAVFEIVEGQMALAESAASGILSAQANRNIFEHEAAECNRFGESPVHRAVFGQGFAAFFHKAFELGMDMERGRQESNAIDNALQHFTRDRGRRVRGLWRDGGLKDPGAGGLVGIERSVQPFRNVFFRLASTSAALRIFSAARCWP